MTAPAIFPFSLIHSTKTKLTEFPLRILQAHWLVGEPLSPSQGNNQRRRQAENRQTGRQANFDPKIPMSVRKAQSIVTQAPSKANGYVKVTENESAIEV